MPAQLADLGAGGGAAGGCQALNLGTSPAPTATATVFNACVAVIHTWIAVLKLFIAQIGIALKDFDHLVRMLDVVDDLLFRLDDDPSDEFVPRDRLEKMVVQLRHFPNASAKRLRQLRSQHCQTMCSD